MFSQEPRTIKKLKNSSNGFEGIKDRMEGIYDPHHTNTQKIYWKKKLKYPCCLYSDIGHPTSIYFPEWRNQFNTDLRKQIKSLQHIFGRDLQNDVL